MPVAIGPRRKGLPFLPPSTHNHTSLTNPLLYTRHGPHHRNTPIKHWQESRHPIYRSRPPRPLHNQSETPEYCITIRYLTPNHIHQCAVAACRRGKAEDDGLETIIVLAMLRREEAEWWKIFGGGGCGWKVPSALLRGVRGETWRSGRAEECSDMRTRVFCWILLASPPLIAPRKSDPKFYSIHHKHCIRVQANFQTYRHPASQQMVTQSTSDPIENPQCLSLR